MERLRKVLSRGQTGLLTLAFLACTLTGCLVPSRDTVKDPRWPTTSTDTPEAEQAPEGQGLIKPFIPPDTAESDENRVVDAPPPPPPDAPPSVPAAVEPPPLGPHGAAAAPPSAAGGPSLPFPAMPDMDLPPPVRFQQTPSPTAPRPETTPTALMGSSDPIRRGPAAGPPVPSEGAPIPQAEAVVGGREKLVKPESGGLRQSVKAAPRPREWEDQKVRSAASELAGKSSKVKKGKFCYSAKHDEWWVILYEDAGNVYDVKQFVWNREREKLEPHLVLKTIGKNRLEEHLAAGDGDKACESFDPVQ